METIINYLDIPNQERDNVLEQLLHLGFCPAYGKQKTIKREMEKSKKDKLPQYLFMFRDNELIGYSFLIGEKENICKPFPWWATDNSDELPLETATHLLEYAIELSTKCDCLTLADRLKTNLENQKKEIAQQTRKYPCPCCGYYTYNVPSEEDCSYICPVCFLENDPFLSSEEEASDCNHGISLKDARLNYQKYGACDKEMLSYVRSPKDDEIR